MADGWVKSYRKLLAWPWFQVPSVAHYWHYCLLKASHAPRLATVGMVQVELLPGQFVSGRNRSSEETGLSPRQIRTATRILDKAGCLKTTIHPTKQFSVISVLNWDTYQGQDEAGDQLSGPATAKRRPARDQATTTDKNGKNGKNGKKKEEDSPTPPETGDAVPPSPLTYPDFPCVGRGPAIFALTADKLAQYAASYPGMNVEAELRKAWQWIVDNPTNRKTHRGLPAFFVRWLNRAQDRGPSAAARRPGLVDFDQQRREQEQARKKAMLDRVFADPPADLPEIEVSNGA